MDGNDSKAGTSAGKMPRARITEKNLVSRPTTLPKAENGENGFQTYQQSLQGHQLVNRPPPPRSKGAMKRMFEGKPNLAMLKRPAPPPPQLEKADSELPQEAPEMVSIDLEDDGPEELDDFSEEDIQLAIQRSIEDTGKQYRMSPDEAAIRAEKISRGEGSSSMYPPAEVSSCDEDDEEEEDDIVEEEEEDKAAEESNAIIFRCFAVAFCWKQMKTDMSWAVLKHKELQLVIGSNNRIKVVMSRSTETRIPRNKKLKDFIVQDKNTFFYDGHKIYSLVFGDDEEEATLKSILDEEFEIMNPKFYRIPGPQLDMGAE